MEEIRNHREINVSFVLQINQSVGNMIYLNNINSSHTVYMVKTLLVDYVGFPADQQRLLLGRDIMVNNNILEHYNVNEHSILMVVRMLRGGARTRSTRRSMRNEPDIIDSIGSENSDISSSEISDFAESLFENTSEEDPDSSED